MSLAYVARRVALRGLSHPHHTIITTRRWSTTNVTSPRRVRAGILLSGGAAAAALLGASVFTKQAIQADYDEGVDRKQQEYTMGSLIRAYIVYTMCSMPSLVDASPKLLQVLMGIPLVRNVTEAVVRITFFNQFVGGDTAQETLPVVEMLRSANKGSLFAYSIEEDEIEATGSPSPLSPTHQGQPVHKRCVDEMIRCIDIAGDFEDRVVGEAWDGRRTWVAVRMTALLPDVQSLINLSSHIVATRTSEPTPFSGCPCSTDLSILSSKVSQLESKPQLRQYRGTERALRRSQRDLCACATERRQVDHRCGIQLVPTCGGRYATCSHARIQQDLGRGIVIKDTPGFDLRDVPGLSAKRGAYHPHEVAAHAAHLAGKHTLSISPDALPPVWSTKAENDACYNECTKTLIGWIKEDVAIHSHLPVAWLKKPRHHPQKIGVLFGTHNWKSCNLVLSELVRRGLASEEGDCIRLGEDVAERLILGQLLGMSDALTDYLVRRTISSAPVVIKYVPYGALSEVMPYLSRRAIENKSVLGDGHAAEERRRAGREIRVRLFG